MPKYQERKILTPIIKLIKHSTITDKRDELRIGNYMIEKVSDLINDDLTKYHTNPQSIENWCHRNSVPNLISGNYVPIILDNNNDYNGIEYNLNLNDEGHQGATSSTNTTANLNSNTGSVNNSANTHTRKKRKVESTKVNGITKSSHIYVHNDFYKYPIFVQVLKYLCIFV